MHRIARNSTPIYYEFDLWHGDSALTHGVFTRLGGSSPAPFDSLNVGGTVGDDPAALRDNLRRIYAALDVAGEAACTVWQVHSADVVVVSGRAAGRHWLARADGMVTNIPALPLTMRFADCTPILFQDPVRRAVGIAHAGWRGTVGKVATRTLEAMTAAYGTNPADVRAAIGPSIGVDHYEVGAEVVAAVDEAFGTTDGVIQRDAAGRTYFDLWAANRRLLVAAGVPDCQIETAGLCTATRTDEFYSHHTKQNKTKHFCAVIALEG